MSEPQAGVFPWEWKVVDGRDRLETDLFTIELVRFVGSGYVARVTSFDCKSVEYQIESDSFHAAKDYALMRALKSYSHTSFDGLDGWRRFEDETMVIYNSSFPDYDCSVANHGTTGWRWYVVSRGEEHRKGECGEGLTLCESLACAIAECRIAMYDWNKDRMEFYTCDSCTFDFDIPYQFVLEKDAKEELELFQPCPRCAAPAIKVNVGWDKWHMALVGAEEARSAACMLGYFQVPNPGAITLGGGDLTDIVFNVLPPATIHGSLKDHNHVEYSLVKARSESKQPSRAEFDCTKAETTSTEFNVAVGGSADETKPEPKPKGRYPEWFYGPPKKGRHHELLERIAADEESERITHAEARRFRIVLSCVEERGLPMPTEYVGMITDSAMRWYGDYKDVELTFSPWVGWQIWTGEGKLDESVSMKSCHPCIKGQWLEFLMALVKGVNEVRQ